MPTTLVWMKALASSIERSTWLSAAKLTTAVGPLLGEQPAHRAAVGDVALDEGAGADRRSDVREALEAAGVGQLVEHRRRGRRSRARASRTKLQPMKPAPPVTRIVSMDCSRLEAPKRTGKYSGLRARGRGRLA